MARILNLCGTKNKNFSADNFDDSIKERVYQNYQEEQRLEADPVGREDSVIGCEYEFSEDFNPREELQDNQDMLQGPEIPIPDESSERHLALNEHDEVKDILSEEFPSDLCSTDELTAQPQDIDNLLGEPASNEQLLQLFNKAPKLERVRINEKESKIVDDYIEKFPMEVPSSQSSKVNRKQKLTHESQTQDIEKPASSGNLTVAKPHSADQLSNSSSVEKTGTPEETVDTQNVQEMWKALPFADVVARLQQRMQEGQIASDMTFGEVLMKNPQEILDIPLKEPNAVNKKKSAEQLLSKSPSTDYSSSTGTPALQEDIEMLEEPLSTKSVENILMSDEQNTAEEEMLTEQSSSGRHPTEFDYPTDVPVPQDEQQMLDKSLEHILLSDDQNIVDAENSAEHDSFEAPTNDNSDSQVSTPHAQALKAERKKERDEAMRQQAAEAAKLQELEDAKRMDAMKKRAEAELPDIIEIKQEVPEVAEQGTKKIVIRRPKQFPAMGYPVVIPNGKTINYYEWKLIDFINWANIILEGEVAHKVAECIERDSLHGVFFDKLLQNEAEAEKRLKIPSEHFWHLKSYVAAVYNCFHWEKYAQEADKVAHQNFN